MMRRDFRTPKALNNIAQLQRSGVAAKRHPGLRVFREIINPEWVAQCVAAQVCGTLSGFIRAALSVTQGARLRRDPGLWCVTPSA